MSGIYHVNTKGLQMAQFKNQSGFLGSLMTDTGMVGGGQAVITPLACDPTMLFMAAALMNVEKKLDNLKELQEEMLDYAKAKEKAKIRGNINVLTDVLNNYKFNWDNEKFKTTKYILVQDVKKDSEGSIQLLRDQIKKKISKKDIVHSDQEVSIKLKKLQEDFNDYKLALYQYSFSTFLEIMLLENFNEQYLESVIKRIEEYTLQYRELYTEGYSKIEEMSKSSVQSFLTRGVAGFTKGAGEIIGKIPVVSKGLVDEALISAGGKIEKLGDKKTDKAMNRLIGSAMNCATPFVENIKTINKIYNEPMEILFDNENIFLYFLPLQFLFSQKAIIIGRKNKALGEESTEASNRIEGIVTTSARLEHR